MSTFDDTLNAQIEALHEAIKDTPEYKQRQEIENALRSFVEAFQALRPVFDDLTKAIMELWEQIVKIVKQAIEIVIDFYWDMQRHFLFCDIKSKYTFIPDKLLTWLIRLIPIRWLMRAREMI